jgi:hypothetical protein
MSFSKAIVCVAALSLVVGVLATSVSVTASSPVAPLALQADEGCSLGFWKNHPDEWQVYMPDDLVGGPFPSSALYGLEGETLRDALRFRGGRGADGAARLLLRQAVTALLNAAHLDVDYPRTEAEVMVDVDVALGTEDRDTMLDLAEDLDDDNNLGCPL